MTIIEADGNLHQPLSVDSLTIYAGQRYSVVVIANQNIGNYWIRAKPIHDLVHLPDFFAGGINSAIFRYAGAPKVEPKTVQTGGQNPLVEARLQPLSNPAAPGTPDVNAADVIKMNMNFNLDLSDLTFNLNGVKTTLPSVPILLQILSGAQAAQDLVGASNVFTLPKNSVVQLSLPAGPSAPVTGHPIHLHGHSFSVIRSAGQTDYNFNNPPRRDVVNLGVPGDNVTIRYVLFSHVSTLWTHDHYASFNTDNAGPWFLHCHVEFHLAAGFAAVFAEDPADIKQSLSAGNGIPSTLPRCSTFFPFPDVLHRII
jgi:iron transport multicopper oxidase